MRRPSGRVPKQPITHLWDRHKEIARRLVMGQRQKDIADDLGMTQSRISIVANSPVVQEKVEELAESRDESAKDVAGRLKALSENAVDILDEVLSKNTTPFNANLQVKVAQDVLDRAGYPKSIRSEGDINHKVSAEGVLGDALKVLREKHSQPGLPAPGQSEPSVITIEAESKESPAGTD